MLRYFKFRISKSKTLEVLLPVIILVLLFVLPLVACPLWGQVVQKKQLTRSDYHLWSDLNLDRISPDEHWASFNRTYDNGIDTLFVQNISEHVSYGFSGGNSSTFTKESAFVCITKKGFELFNLKTRKSQIIEGGIKYDYSNITDKLIILKKTSEENSELIITPPFGSMPVRIKNVQDFSLSPDQRQLLYFTKSDTGNNLHLLDLKFPSITKTIIQSSADNFINFTWQKDGKSAAFFSASDPSAVSSLYYYVLDGAHLSHLLPENFTEFPSGTKMISHPIFKLLISDDLQRVFFGVKKQIPDSKSDNLVQVWNADDKWIYPHRLEQGSFETSPKIMLWQPSENRCTALTTNELPNIMLTGKQQYALLSNPMDYEPQFERDGPRDYYMMNLQTLSKSLFLKEQYDDNALLIPSPQGNYISYFKDSNWWIYNIPAQTHKNITESIGSKFTAKEQTLSPDIPCGTPGWSKGDNEILIYDQYDIWAITPDGSSARRLTHGREMKIKFRINPLPNIWPLKFTYDGSVTDSLDLKKKIFLRAEGEDGKTGFFSIKDGSSEEKIIYEDKYLDQLNYSSNKDILFYREQKFDLSPQLLFKKNKQAAKSFVQSNLHQKNYYWGKAEVIDYLNSKGQKLKGVLLYPANYDPKKKYPMIVSIYEIQFKELHLYTRPKESEIGFNNTVYTTQEYFVLLPDIVLEDQNVGISAADCVMAATKKVIDSGLIDPARIGLLGHSFGGYETAFIITQTNLFAAAVAGGGITDLRSFYLTVNQNSGRANMWRFQSTQWRMHKTPFEAPLLYQQSSPIDHVQNVETPLLLWSGEQDEQVDSHQSIEYYLGLRRLGKNCTMLLYPNQGHVISDREKQKDLTDRIHNWFDYYLKTDRHESYSGKKAY